jgi:hypothetical protein
VTSDYGTEDYYKDFSKKGINKDIDYKTYKIILESILTTIRDKMSSTMYDFKLPFSLGRIIVRKYLPKVKIVNGEATRRLAPDWIATKKLWEEYPEKKEIKQLVYHTNQHSGGYLFTIDYKKDNCKFANRMLYAAQMNRKLKRDISKSIINDSFDSLSASFK